MSYCDEEPACIDEVDDPKIYYCTICGAEPVDAQNGYDTCDSCLRSA